VRRCSVRNVVNAGVPERVATRISEHSIHAVFGRDDIGLTADLTVAFQQVETAALPPSRPVQRDSAKLMPTGLQSP